MAALLIWFKDNWFLLIQSVGIISGLLFTAITIRRETKARKISDLLQLTQQHRELWSEIQRQPNLTRIFQTDVDLLENPITKAEEEFLNMAIVHFNTGWQLAREGTLLSLEALEVDIRVFFNLPIPWAVWQQKKVFRDPEFVRFMNLCLKAKGDGSAIRRTKQN